MRRAVLLALLAGMAAAIVALVEGGDAPYTVRVVYHDATGLKKNNEVKIGGVPAGRIRSVDLGVGDRAILTVELDDGAAPIGRGATATARPVNLLGERYIDLAPGDPRQPAPSGSTIPVSRTRVPTELDEIIDTLDSGTRARLRILLNEAGIGLGLRGGDLNALLDALPSSLDDTQALLRDLVAENGRLRAALTHGDAVLAPIAARRDAVGALVDGAAATFATTAARRDDLEHLVRDAPVALRELRGTLDRLDGTATALRPAAAALRASAAPLAQTLAELPGFADAARPTLRTARRVAPALTRLGRRATPEVRRLPPVLERVRVLAEALRPVSGHLDAGGVAVKALDFVNGWSRVIDDSDGLGHVFRIHIQVGRDQLQRAVERYLPRPATRGRRRAHAQPQRRRAPARASGTPAQAGLPSALADRLADVLNKLIGPNGTGGTTRPDRDADTSIEELLGFLLR